MLKKPTLIKIAVAVAIIMCICCVFMKNRSGAPNMSDDKPVIVTQMPMAEFVPAGFAPDGDEDYETVTTAPEIHDKEAYAAWEKEGFDEYSSPQFKSDLLE